MKYPCGRCRPTPLTRRDMLARCAMGFGGMALSALLADEAYGATRPDLAGLESGPLAPRRPHHRPRVRSVIYLYMDGGPSQVDTFDPKPMLDSYNGKPFPMDTEPTQFNNNGATLASPWKFRPGGESGIPVSDLFPYVRECVDDLAVIRSMTAPFPEHTNANYFLHTGLGIQGRPSMGAWVSYGLGTDNQNLPGFVVLNGGLVPPGGLDNFGSSFLPATYQGSIFRPAELPVANIKPKEKTDQLQRNKLELMHELDAGALDRIGRVDQVESAIANYELAYRMQMAVPELMDISDESEATKQMYGLDAKHKGTQTFAMECLIARRLVERGVRFIELTCPNVGVDRWDQHNGLRKGHELNAGQVDQPIAGLLRDLKQRGLFDETLVIWSGEFGRTPFAQGSDGRDHNQFGFSLWMAGGGIKGGTVYGATDEFGYKAIENKVTIHDIHATMLHLLGINHLDLTYRFSGRDIRLTDVHGEIIGDVLA